ncbi:uncharacterized protein LOC113637773 [Tachysurus fulvidraco]|uniref:uncharacterized protein LOC113637773 n=1 Tax=Tachysurus fulvidraco TaxID=1234273 RepID=UPI001FEFCAAE|nr:uncharacterized protein LOC113637773 [Tachysurus fulvidraco]
MPPKKSGKGKAPAKKKKPSKKKAKANKAGAKAAAHKKKVKKNTGMKSTSKKLKADAAVKGNKAGPSKQETKPNTAVKGNKAGPSKQETKPNTAVKGNKAGPSKQETKPNTVGLINTSSLCSVKGGAGQKRKNPNPAQGQNEAKRMRTLLAPAPAQPMVHIVHVPVPVVQTSGRRDFYQPSAARQIRFNNDEVSNNTAVCAQSHKIDNSRTGNENITDENLLFLKDKRVQLISRIKNVTEIVDHLDLTGEQAAKVRAEKTEQEKMRMLLDFIQSTSAAENLVLSLWDLASDIMEDLIDE